eukprot:Rmarinus@m.13960
MELIPGMPGRTGVGVNLFPQLLLLALVLGFDPGLFRCVQAHQHHSSQRSHPQQASLRCQCHHRSGEFGLHRFLDKVKPSMTRPLMVLWGVVVLFPSPGQPRPSLGVQPAHTPHSRLHTKTRTHGRLYQGALTQTHGRLSKGSLTRTCACRCTGSEMRSRGQQEAPGTRPV